MARPVLGKKIMKVLIVTTSFPRWRDDHRAPYILELVRNLQDHGVKVRVLSIHSPGALDQEEWDGVEIIRTRYLPEKFEFLQKDDGGIPVTLEKNRFSAIALLPLIISLYFSIIKFSRDCDLIHAQWTLAGFVTWMSRPFHKRHYIVTIHGSDINKSKKNKLLAKITSLVLNHSSMTIAVSHSLYQSALRMGVKEKNLCIIPDGVDTNKFLPGIYPREFLLLTIGALTINKGGNVLLFALPEVFNMYPEYNLVWIGSGPQLESWKSIANRLEIQNKIFFIGNQTQEEVISWLKRAQLMILPSLSEGLGVVLLEALACGVPCIGSNVGGIPDILTDEVGQLVPPNDSKALAKAIITMLNDKDSLNGKGRMARNRAVKEFDWKKISLGITDIYYKSIISANVEKSTQQD